MTPDENFMLLVNLFNGKKLDESDYKKAQNLLDSLDCKCNAKRLTNNFAMTGQVNIDGSASKLDKILKSFINGSVDVERLFSLLKLIVTRLRSSMVNERKENLLILSFNRGIGVSCEQIFNKFRGKCSDRKKLFVKL